MRRKGAPIRLIKSVVDTLTCPPGRKDALFFDAELKGFALRVTSGGARIFLFQYRAPGLRTVRRMVLGEYGGMTVDKAREQAEILRGLVRGGRDPFAEREAERRAAAEAAEAAKAKAAADALTFRVLVQRWQAMHLANRRESYRREAPRTLLRAFASWAERPAHAITGQEVVAELDRIATTVGPVAGRLALAYGRAMYGWAVGRREFAANPFAGVPAPAQAVSRDRVLSDLEVGAIWAGAEGLGWPFGPFLRVLLLTLQRRDEVAGMRWSELGAGGALWTIPAERAKNNRAHLVHLAPAARAILRDLPRFEGCDLVFSTTPRQRAPEGKREARVRLTAFSAIKEQLDAAIAEARAKAGVRPAALAPWRLHDFRRTGVSRLAQLGIPPHVCDRLLNHVHGSISGVAAVYQRHEFEEQRREALELWAKHVGALVSPRRGARPRREAGAGPSRSRLR